MKKLLSGILGLSVCLSLFACGKKKDSTTKETTTPTTTTKKDYNIPDDNDKYTSNYTPILSDKLPRIDINVNDPSIEAGHEMDFVTVPNRDNKWDYTQCNVTVTDDTDTVTVDSKAAGVKVRGNWTTYYEKKPLRIKFDKKQAMLGLNDDPNNPDDGKYKNWLLLAMYKDWSMLRDASSFYLAHLLGAYYVSDFRLVDVYINNQYWGVYLLCEQQEVKEGRVTITEPEKDYTGTDIGYFLEFDGYYYEEADLENFTIDYKPLLDANNRLFPSNKTEKYQNGFTIKSDIYSQEQNTFIKNYMQNVFNICYSAIVDEEFYEFNNTFTGISKNDSLDSYQTISKIIDVDSLVNAYILAELTCDVDIAWSSFFMDVDFGENGSKKLVFEAPWDFDSGYGNTRGCLDSEGYYASSVFTNAMNEKTANPWFLLFYQCDWFRTLVKNKLNALKTQGAFEKITTFIDTVSTKYKTAFEANYAKWHNCGWKGNESPYGNEFDLSPAGNCTTEAEAAAFMKQWFTKRYNNLVDLFKDE